MNSPVVRAANDPIQSFTDRLAASLADASFIKAVLAKYRGPEAELQRINLRLVRLVRPHDPAHLQLVYRHATRDITRNLPLHEGVAMVHELLGADGFRSARLHTRGGVDELTITHKGQAHLRHLAQSPGDATPVDESHNRVKHRLLSLDRPFLVELGVTTAQHQLIPAMARKWKQINKFIEVFAAALAASRLAGAQQLRIVDFGCGKGYLTFAIHDWLRQSRGIDAQVAGVELRPDLIELCNAAIARLGLPGLRIEQGDLRSWQPQPLDVMIALHACDTATDHAIHLAIRAGAEVILCSPCCHKQIRPQLLSPHPLRPILQHGVHLGQEAEMLTDGLRALLLEAAGYDTQVFEFIALEHSHKNKMILAVKRAQPKSPDIALAQIAEIKAFYGIREHCLETLLAHSFPRRVDSAAGAVADNPA